MATKQLSRPKRWEAACAQAEAALNDLVELQGEYESWKENLPDNLQENGPVAEKLTAIVDLDLSSALDTVTEAGGLDLPRGFGKD